MRALKLTGIVLGVLVALIALMLIGVRLFVNPNDFKGRIEKTVKDRTGRELHLPGDIKLSVFPWIALELGPVSLSNPTGFPAEPFIQVKHLALRVRLLPLLHKELNVGRIDIDGLDLRLLKNAQGKGNWEDFGGKTPAPAPAASGSSIPALRDLSGVNIKDSRISYQDMVANAVNLSIGRVAAGGTTPVSLETQLTSGRGAAPVELSLKLDLAPDFATKKYQVSKLELQGARAAADGVHALQVTFDTPAATADLGAQTLSVPAFSAQQDRRCAPLQRQLQARSGLAARPDGGARHRAAQDPRRRGAEEARGQRRVQLCRQCPRAAEVRAAAGRLDAQGRGHR